MLRKSFQWIAVCLVFSIVMRPTPPVWAQQTLGAISGTVSDTSGALLAEVTVTAVEDQTKLTRVIKTNNDGGYQFVNLPIGTYTITFTHNGFETQNVPNILVQADRTVSVNAGLKVGSITTSVTVTETPLLNAVDTTNGYVLDKSQIDAIPLPTGSFTGLAILSPGVNAEISGGTGANSGLGNAPIWANGQRDTSNSFLLNGVDASNLFNGKSTSQVASFRVVNNTGVGNAMAGGVQQSSASVYLAIGQALPTPAPETIQEVRVNTSMYDAQQGSTSGAHIDMSTLSGTNAYHGTAYLHRGTDWLNAAPFFFKQDGDIPANEKVPQLHRYIAGGGVGGPIIKDKLFAYLAYQHVHVSDQEIGISRFTVPYGLTDDRSPATLANVANCNWVAPTSAYPDPCNGPGSANPADPNYVNPTMISPVAQFLMQYKMPNGGFLVPSATPGVQPTYNTPDNTSIPGTAYFTSDQAVANLDWNATSKDTLALKYYYQHDPTLAPYAYSNTPGFEQHLDTGSQVFSLNNTIFLKPNLSVTGVIGFLREKAYGYNDQPFTAQTAGINTFGSTYFPGISIVDNFGNNSPNNPGYIYNASMNIGPGSFTQAPFTGLFQNRIMPSGNAIWILGRHTVTFGASYAYTQLNIRNDRIGKGMIASANFAGFLQGNISFQNNDFTTTSLMLGDANRYYRANQTGTYVQDKFQILPNLSLTAGVRYDWNGGLTEKYGRLFNFDPDLYSYNETTDQIISNGFIMAGNNKQFPTKGVSDTTLTGRQWGIGPRIGLAYSPKQNDGKVVIRAGAGMYYDRGELFTYLSPGYAAGEVSAGPFGVTQSPPFVNTIQCPGAPSFISPCSGTISLSNPWGTTPGTPPSGNPADITKYLPNQAAIVNGAPLFAIGTYNRANKLPYTINYTLDWQWQPRNDIAIDLGYIGNLGRHQVIPVPFNQAGTASPSNPIHGQTYTYGYSVQTTACDYYACSPATLPNGQPFLWTYEGGNIDLRVPYIGYSSESETYKAAGISAYNALQAHLEKRLSGGLQVAASYTYSHATDEQSALGLFYNGNNPLNLRDGYGSSDFDRTHVVNFNYSYQLPKFVAENNWKGKVINGWALQGITIIQSGQPYSVIDYSGAIGSIFYGTSNGITNPVVPLAPGCDAHRAYTGHSGAFGTPALNGACFTLPLLSPGDLGGAIPAGDDFETNFTTGQRNIFRQSWQRRADISLVKAMNIGERITARYTFDVFNVTNTTSFDIPGDNVSQNEGYNDFPVQGTPAAPSPASCAAGNPPNGTFFNCPTGLGYTTRAIGSPRQIQMSLQLTF
ncbi:TonB-dependent receptor [Alloacidobacterium dinghuense]|uniref:TonB-dependent receptor n=1 Tax=Alloacidobacterium dinghuense TaxID=2763107 RepID=A0A7G8BID9_9BACT|nr:TonB-dependent receptor [Alloacidobacterium dinghuense]QNI32309.1 TonB-dependent receptor [Alloacidobacterium dinghuense]